MTFECAFNRTETYLDALVSEVIVDHFSAAIVLQPGIDDGLDYLGVQAAGM